MKKQYENCRVCGKPGAWIGPLKPSFENPEGGGRAHPRCAFNYEYRRQAAKRGQKVESIKKLPKHIRKKLEKKIRWLERQ